MRVIAAVVVTFFVVQPRVKLLLNILVQSFSLELRAGGAAGCSEIDTSAVLTAILQRVELLAQNPAQFFVLCFMMSVLLDWTFRRLNWAKRLPY